LFTLLIDITLPKLASSRWKEQNVPHGLEVFDDLMGEDIRIGRIFLALKTFNDLNGLNRLEWLLSRSWILRGIHP
jgi:hypothetical protein